MLHIKTCFYRNSFLLPWSPLLALFFMPPLYLALLMISLTYIQFNHSLCSWIWRKWVKVKDDKYNLIVYSWIHNTKSISANILKASSQLVKTSTVSFKDKRTVFCLQKFKRIHSHFLNISILNLHFLTWLYSITGITLMDHSLIILFKSKFIITT